MSRTFNPIAPENLPPSTSSEPVYTLNGYFLGETAKATKFVVHEINGIVQDSPREEWFPFSQVKSMIRAASPQEMDSIKVKQWILRQKGLI